MNITKITVEKYQKQYANLRFERRGLFELIRAQFNPLEVLYPGCSIHLTPAFYFPHVIFIDNNPAARDFFSNRQIIFELIQQRQKYRRTPHFEFIFQDFTQPLPVPQTQFDLLLALYTGGVAKACKSWLKFGGLLVTNNHQNDALEATKENDLALIATIQKYQNKYRLIETESGKSLKIDNLARRSRRYLRQTNRGAEYIEGEDYFLFKRIRPRS